MNHKLRSDSVFTELTNEQIEQLENWLFEEKLSYKETIEKIEKEFGVKTSQTALGRYFRRLAEERAQEWRVETVAQCLEALATAKGDGTLQAGLFVMANMHAVRLMTEEKPSFREITGWLRAMTSAGTFEMKRVEAHRAEEKQRQWELAEKERKEREAKQRQLDHEANVAYWNRRDEKRKATIAAKKAEAEAKARDEVVKTANASNKPGFEKGKCHLSPAQWLPKPATSQFPDKRQALRASWSPKGGEGEELAQRTVHGFDARGFVSGNSLPEAERVADGVVSATEHSAVVVAAGPPSGVALRAMADEEGGTPNVAEPERRLVAGLVATECPDDAKTASTDPAPEPTLVAVSEVPSPNGAAAEKSDGLTAAERSGCFRIFRG